MRMSPPVASVDAKYVEASLNCERSSDPTEQILLPNLSQLRPDELPPSIFNQFARLTVTAIVELVPLRQSRRGVEVLLVPRPEDDPYWAGMLHTPGTILRVRDSSYEDALHRVIHSELDGVKLTKPPVFVGNILHTVARGSESAAVYYAELAERPSVGDFYCAEELPSSTIDTQRGMIALAVRAYADNEG